MVTLQETLSSIYSIFHALQCAGKFVREKAVGSKKFLLGNSGEGPIFSAHVCQRRANEGKGKGIKMPVQNRYFLCSRLATRCFRPG